jgi:putative nucleotidyltransferase with HDIG domain
MPSQAPQQLRLDEAGDRYSIQTTVQMMRGQRWRAVGTALVFYLIFCGIFIFFFYSPPYHAEVGVIATAAVTAPYQITLPDQQASLAQRERVLRERPQIWVRDGKVISRARQRVKQFFDLFNARDPASPAELRDLIAAARNQTNLQLDENSAGQFMTVRLSALPLPMTRIDVVRDLEFIINELLVDRRIVENKVRYQAMAGQGVLRLLDEHHLPLAERPDPQQVLAWPAETRQYLLNIVLPRYFPGDDVARGALRQACADLLMQVLAPNLVHDVDETQRISELLLKQIDFARIVKTYEPGELIVKQGDSLTALQADALDRLNAARYTNLSYKISGILLFVATVFLAVGAYLRRFRREVLLDSPTITLHALPPLFAIIIGCSIVKLGYGPDAVSLWFPSILVGALSTLLITPQVAFILVLVSALAFGIIMGQNMSFMVLALFQGFAAVLATRQVRARLEILRVGLKVGLVNLFTMLMLVLLTDLSLQDHPWQLFVAFFTAMLYSASTYFLIGVFETLFGVITDLKLLELTGLQHKLLLMLEEKAPGSYQHVLNVTKLAEAGANAISANYLLVRAGAYFHDIGKMMSPKYFSENQTSLEDKKAHSRISPYMSVLIIKNHVKEGIKLAKDFGLPQRIIDFIPEHHGTSLIRYFYTEALKRYEESEAVDQVREEDFRYPGPKPRSIETAIVMLADSVEAITTSKFTGGQVQENELRRTVQAAITDKFNEGQFDECSLTLRHLHMLREAFVKTLMARYHFRVQYPSLPARAGAIPTARTLDSVPITVSGPA